LFLVVVRHSHHDFVEQFSSTLDHIEMTIRDRIKAARVNRPSHMRKFAEELENEKCIEARGTNETAKSPYELPKIRETRN
jgi:hypothetical protein